MSSHSTSKLHWVWNEVNANTDKQRPRDDTK
jgi:hypothetical protein